MNKSLILAEAERAHIYIAQLLSGSSPKEHLIRQAGKWCMLEHADHVLKGLSRMNVYLGLPKNVIESKFGKREAGTFDTAELIARYSKRLQEGAVSTEAFLPAAPAELHADAIVLTLQEQVKLLSRQLEKWTEGDLDTHVCNHPLLGKMSTREMLHFIIYHADHHAQSMRNIGVA